MVNKIDDLIICPYCDFKHYDQCDYPEGLDNEEAEMDCDSCGKTFIVSGELSWTYRTYEKKESK